MKQKGQNLDQDDDPEEAQITSGSGRNPSLSKRFRRDGEKKTENWAKVKKSMIKFKRACKPSAPKKGSMSIVKAEF